MLIAVHVGPFGTCLSTSLESCLFLFVIFRLSVVYVMLVVMMMMYDEVMLCW
jgi:hypothetical protein